MNHRATPRFWYGYRRLPAHIRQLADSCFALLRQDPRHPSLHFKKVGRFWSARVGLYYRALAVEHGSDIVWFWIGSHADYDRLVGRRKSVSAENRCPDFVSEKTDLTPFFSRVRKN